VGAKLGHCAHFEKKLEMVVFKAISAKPIRLLVRTFALPNQT
jgi:hypothetical protein